MEEGERRKKILRKLQRPADLQTILERFAKRISPECAGAESSD
jgi:hypothetical protein